jgi:1-deoxy-D-xylulose-5-phosphate reductoisomerase
MKNIALLGSTGSIGTQTLDVVRANRDRFHVSVLAANRSDALLEKQIQEFSPELAVLVDDAAAAKLRSRYIGKTKIISGRQGLLEAAAYSTADIVVTSMMGFAGLEPTMAALDAGKNIALANKETLVVAGELVMARAREKGVAILPVDSEHCALFQCLQGEKRESMEKLILTCSGGPFRGKRKEELARVSVKDCLNHPTWSMGKKITIDSATLVNKGLEVIEAKWLYHADYEQIQVVVHPQSIVHSMVQYQDGAVVAQLGSTDMRLPIQYALTYPDRQPSVFRRLDFWDMQPLTFAKPDIDTFRGLALAYEAGRIGGTMPCVMNAANEVAVEAFLAGGIGFLDIYDIIERTMEARQSQNKPTLELFFAEDAWARDYARKLLRR